MKRILSFLLVLTMCMSLTSTAAFAVDNTFTDVKTSDYFYEPVLWAVDNGITSGLKPTLFAPEESCTRAQVVTFLYRYAGSPTPENQTNPFTDLKASEYYYNAVLWAVENGITSGLKPTLFAPDATCTRAQVVTFLHRYAGSPTPVNQTHSFTDLKTSEYYYYPVLWAVENGITSGLKPTLFAPEDTCTRAQVVTFLYRYSLQQPEEDPDTTPTIKVNDVTPSAGAASVTIPVVVSNNPGILGMTLSVIYDESVMTLTDVENGEALSNVLSLTAAKELKSGCNLVWDGQDIMEEEIQDGVIVYLTFAIEDSAAAGTYEVSLEAKEIIDNNLEPLDITMKSGNVVIK